MLFDSNVSGGRGETNVRAWVSPLLSTTSEEMEHSKRVQISG